MFLLSIIYFKQKIKSVADNQCLLQLQRQQQDSKRDSKGAPGNVKFENTKSLEQFVVMLSTKYVSSDVCFFCDDKTWGYCQLIKVNDI